VNSPRINTPESNIRNIKALARSSPSIMIFASARKSLRSYTNHSRAIVIIQ
jgi:hypothetical protein